MDRWIDTRRFTIAIFVIGAIIGLFWMISGYQLKETGMFLAKDIKQQNTGGKISVIVMNSVENEVILSEYIKFSRGETAFDVLNKVLEVKYKDYPGVGKYVVSINGLEQTETAWWLYEVNGKTLNVASDKYELQDGDVIMWKYTPEIPFE
jgi:hypothetical protein